MFQIKRATRKQARARIALCGPSGSGKTLGALLLAKGIGGRVGLIDTERRSASLYANVIPFDVLELEPPYSPARYCEAIAALEQHGSEIIIIDSLSHAWSGQGGLLERVDQMKATAKNAMSPWAKATPEQQRLVDTILRSPAHLICTMRVKTEWVLDESNVNGQRRTAPRKVGLAPVQRDGIEYEFTTTLDITHEHLASPSKDRTGVFGEVGVDAYLLTEQHGKALSVWLAEGEQAEPEPPRYVPEGTYVKPPGFVPPAEPPRVESPKDETGFEDDGSVAEPILDPKVFWAAVRKRARQLEIAGKDEVEEFARMALATMGLESSRAIPESRKEEMLLALSTLAFKQES